MSSGPSKWGDRRCMGCSRGWMGGSGWRQRACCTPAHTRTHPHTPAHPRPMLRTRYHPVCADPFLRKVRFRILGPVGEGCMWGVVPGGAARETSTQRTHVLGIDWSPPCPGITHHASLYGPTECRVPGSSSHWPRPPQLRTHHTTPISWRQASETATAPDEDC